MSDKATRPLFSQAISAVKKQVDSGQYNKKKLDSENKQQKTDHQFEDMSSGQQQRLKQLGVDLSKTKNISKSNNVNHKNDPEQGSWKHDRYRADRQPEKKLKFQPYPNKKSSFTIWFPSKQQYNKIYSLVKSQKAFIQEINEHSIKFSKQYAFNTCKNIFKNQGIQFLDESQINNQPNQLNNKDGKKNIFNRLNCRLIKYSNPQISNFFA